MGQALGGSIDRLGLGKYGTSLAHNMVGGIANAATRSLVNGSDFGDNLMAALPDILGNTIGNAIGGAVASRGAPRTGAGSGGDIIVTAGRPHTPNILTDGVDFSSTNAVLANIRQMSFDVNKSVKGVDYAVSQVAQQIIDSMPAASGVQYASGNYALSGGQFNGQTSSIDAGRSPYYYNRGTGTIDYYEAGLNGTAVDRVDASRTAMMNQRLSELNWGVAGAVTVGPVVGGLLAAAAPAVGTFLLANGPTISAGGQIFGEIMGVPGAPIMAAGGALVGAERVGLGAGGSAGRQVLYHYTNEAGAAGILESNALNPSLWRSGTKDVAYGNGQYLSDIVPGTRTSAELSRDFLGQPFQGRRFTNYVEIDASGLGAVQGRAGVYVIPNQVPLDLTGRLLSSGKVPGR